MLDLERLWYRVRLRVRSLLRRDLVERELQEEYRLHLERAAEREEARGLTAREALHAAQRRMGGIEQHAERSRDARGVAALEHIVRDLRHALRVVLRAPGFTVVVVLTLGLGIGANTALFSLIDAVLLRSLPVQRPAELVFLNVGGTDRLNGPPPYPYFEQVRAGAQSFAGLAAFTGEPANLVIDGRAEQVFGQYVSGSFFELLGVRPHIGRLLTEADERLAPVVAVISHGYWQRRFGGSPTIVGQVIRLGERPLTIVGVLPPEFTGLHPGVRFDITLPITLRGPELLSSRETWGWYEVVARLRPGVVSAQARADADRIYRNFVTNLPGDVMRRNFQRIELVPAAHGLSALRDRFARPLFLLVGVVALVLLIACANVANLLLARAQVRGREVAVRLALGAGPARIARQLPSETLVLFALGGVAALGFAYWAGRFLAGFFAVGRMPITIDLAFDGRALAFTAALTLGTMLVFGLAPALRTAHADPQRALTGSGTRSVSRSNGAGRILVVTQVAFSLILLFAAGLFVRTMSNLADVDTGFTAAGLLTMSVQHLEGSAGEQDAQSWRELLRAVRATPGVEAAALSVLVPMSGRDRGVAVTVPGFQPGSGQDEAIHLNHISDDYFRTLSTGLVAGREFTTADRSNSPAVAILNQEAAQFYFGERNPIGAVISLRRGAQQPSTIVGVVANASHNNLRESAPRFIYLPIAQPIDQLGRLTLTIRTAGSPVALLPVVRNQMEGQLPNLVLSDVLTMENQIDAVLLRERLLSTLCAFFGLLALLLSAVGLYGVMSNTVSARTREIGIRSALGARPLGVTWLVLRQSVAMVTIGIAIGLPAALILARPMARLLFGLAPSDPLTALSSAALLLAVGTIAAWLPAWKAARIDPVRVLNRE